VKTLRYVICDVFTDQPLAGNPLAVFTDARGLSGELMQALAREMNLTETAFVLPGQARGQVRVRIFNRSRELPFSGHATLGTAFVLGGPLQTEQIRTELLAGEVPVRLERDGAHIHFAWMSPPPARPLAVDEAAPILLALGLKEPGSPLLGYDNGLQHICLYLPSAGSVAALAPNFSALAAATSAGVSAFHFDGELCTARYFAPRCGIDEDAATGSAAAPMALYLKSTGLLADGQALRIAQGAEVGRPSTLYARLTAAESQPSIEVGGSARIVARGQFVI
jgi:trans-2,3-dihydro-3-hydroxyanthranilate isomerase